MGRIIIVLQSFIAFVAAWHVKLRGDTRRLVLPKVGRRKKPLGGGMPFLIACADCWVRFGCMRTGRKCFFRSYILASLLRWHGEAVDLNIGMRNLGVGSEAVGHCWVSSPGGAVLGESNFQPVQYPVLMGQSRNGVRFWAGGPTGGNPGSMAEHTMKEGRGWV